MTALAKVLIVDDEREEQIEKILDPEAKSGAVYIRDCTLPTAESPVSMP